MDIAEVKQENDRELIAKVQQHPVLYNLSAPKYKDTKAKPAIWDEIAESIDGIGGINLFFNVFKIKFSIIDGKAAQARWQSLRDQFRKKLKPASGSAAEDATPYIYAEEMDFLRPFFQERPRLKILLYVCEI
jgi:cytochrome c556